MNTKISNITKATMDNKEKKEKNEKNEKNEKKEKSEKSIETENEEVCIICAKEISFYAIGSCNHAFCHLCSLRLRALYKSNHCPICKTNQDVVVFTETKSKTFEEFNLKEMVMDDKLKIYFKDEKNRVDALKILQYNCPFKDCDFISLVGFHKLQSHVTAAHNKLFCNVCAHNKKEFCEDMELYSRKELARHMKYGSDKVLGKDDGFRGHPECRFCNASFFDNDGLYEHLKKKHESCFVCQRLNPRDQSYYKDYAELEKHFEKEHFVCKEKDCLEEKFVVFESLIDLRAHELEKHTDKFSKIQRAKMKKALQVNLEFKYSREKEQEPSNSRRREQKNGSSNENTPKPTRRVNAPAGFGIVSNPSPPAEAPIVVQNEEVTPLIAEEKWPDLNGQITTPKATPKAPTFADKKDFKNKELWPELSELGPSSSKPIAQSKKSNGSSSNLYSKQMADKRPPLPKDSTIFDRKNAPSLSQPTLTSSFSIPSSTLEQIAPLVNRDKGKMDAVKEFGVLFFNGMMQPREYLLNLAASLESHSTTSEQSQANAIKIASLLIDHLDKTKAVRLQVAIREIKSKNEAFPGLPSKPKSKHENNGVNTRKVLVIKPNGTSIPKPKPKNSNVSKPSFPQPILSSSSTQTNDDMSKISSDGKNKDNKHKIKGKKMDWTQL